MKKYVSVALLLAFGSSVWGIPFSAFKGWDDLVKNSPEIFIARCVSTVDFISSSNNKPTIITDGMINSDVEVVSVLKGDESLGLSRLASQYRPYRGEYFLVFANYGKSEFNSGYTAVEGYRVVSLDHNFMTNQMAGKALDEQIDIILARRLSQLNEEMARENDEKNRIEARLKMSGQTNGLPSAPPKAQEPLPSKNGVAF